MSTKQDGGPAFPQHGWTKDSEILKRMKKAGYGLTKRQWFAGQALVGILAAYGHKAKVGADNAVMIPTSIFRCAWDAADEMLKQEVES